MKRFVDKPINTFVTGGWWPKKSSDVCVVCPKCNGMGIVTFSDENYCFTCQTCLEKKEQSRFIYKHVVKVHCNNCDRYFRKEIPEDKHQFKVLNVNCPHCDDVISAKVEKLSTTTSSISWSSMSLRKGAHPAFGYPLYFLDYLDVKPIWALNREHLQYLIDYIEADLRERPVAKYNGELIKKGESYRLPTFMKLAKNRNKVLKILKRMQNK